MKKSFFLIFLGLLVVGGLFISSAEAATNPLVGRVNEAFTSVFGRNPNATEQKYWAARVSSGEKKTFDALKGAMYFQKAAGKTMPATTTKTSPSAPAKTTATNQQQLIKDVLPLFIQIYGGNPSNAEKAWWRKRISCGEIKNEAQLVSSMKFHKAKKVRMGGNGICGGLAKKGTSSSSDGLLRKSVAGLSTHPAGDEIRVGIYSTNGSAIHVTANSEFQVREGKSKVLAKLGKDDIVQVSWSDGKYHVRGSGLDFDTEQEIRLVPLNGGIMQVKSYSDPSVTYPGKNYNRFRGLIEVRKCDGCNELWAINELRIEHYLRGLGETSGTGPEEYIKALGIAARTYALYHKVVTGGRRPKQGFDLGKTADDQIYRGYEYEIITPRMSSIFNKVKGVVATDSEGDNLVTTVYFSDSDGRTRSAKEAWGTDRFPHLQHSVKDPHHASSSCKGHCVGMSAQGAFGFADKDNWNYQKILKYYFQGIKLVKAY